MAATEREAVDLELHGLLRIRLLDPTAADVSVVRRQLGAPATEPQGEPDFTIRFVDELPLDRPLRYLGLDDVGFTDDAFVVLRGPGKTTVRVMLPFDRVGQAWELVCERGTPSVPLLVALVNLTLLGKGVLPLHASALNYAGRGLLITGWSKGGKTETLLAFMQHGAEYVGDEWVWLVPEDRRMYGMPEPIRVWDWQLAALPAYRTKIRPGDRVRLAATRLLADAATGRDGERSWPRPSLLRRAAPLIRNQLSVRVPPARLFGSGACALRGTVDMVVLVMSHESSQTTVAPLDVEEVVRRMVASLQYERLPLLATYHQFRFAFPHRRNELLEDCAGRESRLLSEALEGRPALVVSHPYPFDINAVFEALRPQVR